MDAKGRPINTIYETFENCFDKLRIEAVPRSILLTACTAVFLREIAVPMPRRIKKSVTNLFFAPQQLVEVGDCLL